MATDEPRDIASIDGARAAVRRRALIGIASAGLFLGYMLSWWNMYFAPNNGGEVSAMNEFLHGRYPYRDYYLPTPPGLPILESTFAHLFGLRIFPYYVLGLLLRTAFAWSLYRLISARRSAFVAGVAVAVAAITSCSDDAEFVAHYHHYSIGLLVLATLAAYRCVVPGPSPLSRRAFAVHALLAGVAAGAAFLMKQTMGVVGTGIIAAFCVAALARQKRTHDLGTFVAAGFGGFSVVLGLTTLWLVQHGMLAAYIHLVYFAAPAAKGGALSSLARPITGLTIRFLPGILVAAIAVGAAAAALWIAGRNARPGGRHVTSLGAFLGIGALLALGIVLGRESTLNENSLKSPLYALIYVSFAGSFVFAVLRTVQFWRTPSDESALHGALLSWMAFACAYSMSLSWPALEVMNFPGLAVVVSEADASLRAHPYRRAARAATTTLFVYLVALSSWYRHRYPYHWAYWTEPPIAFSDYRSRQPALWGMMMSEPTAEFIDTTTDLIKTWSGPDDTILTFPHLWLFSGLADRRAVGFVNTHWFDTCTDDLARADAAEILKHPPAVIVAMDIPEPWVAEQEQYFRHGAPSGQRDVIRAIETLVARDHYLALARFPAGGFPVTVWARPRPGMTPPQPSAPNAPNQERR